MQTKIISGQSWINENGTIVEIVEKSSKKVAKVIVINVGKNDLDQYSSILSKGADREVIIGFILYGKKAYTQFDPIEAPLYFGAEDGTVVRVVKWVNEVVAEVTLMRIGTNPLLADKKLGDTHYIQVDDEAFTRYYPMVVEDRTPLENEDDEDTISSLWLNGDYILEQITEIDNDGSCAVRVIGPGRDNKFGKVGAIHLGFNIESCFTVFEPLFRFSDVRYVLSKCANGIIKIF